MGYSLGPYAICICGYPDALNNYNLHMVLWMFIIPFLIIISSYGNIAFINYRGYQICNFYISDIWVRDQFCTFATFPVKINQFENRNVTNLLPLQRSGKKIRKSMTSNGTPSPTPKNARKPQRELLVSTQAIDSVTKRLLVRLIALGVR